MDEMYACRCVNKLFMKVTDRRLEDITRDDRMHALQRGVVGGSNVLEWVYRVGKFSRDDLGRYSANTFIWICLRERLDILQWYGIRYKPTRKDIMSRDNIEFRLSCMYGNLKFAQWFDQKCQYTREELVGETSWVEKGTLHPILRWAYERGYLSASRWLDGRLENVLDKEWSFPGNALRWACIFGHLKVVQWLDGKCRFTRKELTNDRNCALQWACILGHLKVARWLDEKCDFTRKELRRVMEYVN